MTSNLEVEAHVVGKFVLDEIGPKLEKDKEDKYKIRWIYLIRYDPNLLGLGRIHLILTPRIKGKTSSHSPSIHHYDSI